MRYCWLLFLTLSCSLAAQDIDGQGFIRHWLLLGPYGQTGFNNPGEAAQADDYLTDGGAITEATIVPFPGMIVNTDYAVAASTGLLSAPNPSVNPQDKPEWFEYVASQDTIDFQLADAFGGDVNDCMAYACVYVENWTGAPINNVVAAGCSDDGFVVIVGHQVVINHSIARGVGAAGEIQDRSGPISIPVGLTRVLVKVFEGAGGWAFRLRFEDAGGAPILSNRIGVSMVPYGPCPTSVDVLEDSWLREFTFRWQARFSEVAIYEGGTRLASTTDLLASELRVSDVPLGEHRYEFRARIGSEEPACTPVTVLAAIEPLWPAEFTCAYRNDRVEFSWRNPEYSYDVLKIQENGADVLGVVYDPENAYLVGARAGTHTYALVAELVGYQNGSGSTCQVEVTATEPIFLRGDANADGTVNIADAVFTLAYLFSKDTPPRCRDAGDANDDGDINISDPIKVLSYLFAKGSLPDPGPDACGPDAEPDELEACDYPAEGCSG